MNVTRPLWRSWLARRSHNPEVVSSILTGGIIVVDITKTLSLIFTEHVDAPSPQVLPDIAQLVERSTVEVADIEWSLVRFRVSGLFAYREDGELPAI